MPYCLNWKVVASEDAKPEEVNWSQKVGGNAKARTNSKIDSFSIAERSHIDLEDLQ
jgi:hypothetical protein